MNIDAGRIGVGGQWKWGKPRGHGWAGYEDSKEPAYGENSQGRWPANLILDEEAAAMLDEQSGESVSSGGSRSMSGGLGKNIYGKYDQTKTPLRQVGLGDSGGASRFFYTAKASKADRGHGNTHPTVKPQAVIKYLMQLVTRSGSVVLDPFSGSGTTIKAAQDLGRIGIGLDLERTYIDIGQERTAQQGLML